MIYNGHTAAASIGYNLLADPQLKLSDHFALTEFACHDGSIAVVVHPALVALLEAIRRGLGRAVIINSGYRTAAHNKAVGGAKTSRHLWGMAADIKVPGVPTEKVRQVAAALGAGGIGHYRGRFVHVDVEGEMRRWHG